MENLIENASNSTNTETSGADESLNFRTSKTLRFANSFPRVKRKLRISQIKFLEKVGEVKRMTKVVKGGKILTFRAVILIGDLKGRVGMGIGRSLDVNTALAKALLKAKKTSITVPLTYTYSIPHVTQAKFGASNVMLRPAAEGTGLIAGGPVRTLLEFAGVKNILSKQFGANSIINNSKATILALSTLNTKVELGKYQLLRKKRFYSKIMRRIRKFT